jgi:drug/metabolite transporter (DMT)-like permease
MLAANLGLLLTAIAWAAMIPFINALLVTWDPYFLAAIRYVLGAPVLILMLLALEPGPLMPRGVPPSRTALLGAVGIGVFAPAFTLGIAYSNPVTAVVLSAAGPVVAAGVGWLFYRFPVERTMWPAVILAVLGCALATYDPFYGAVPFDFRGGEPLILFAAACWSWYSMAAQTWLAGSSQLRITAVTVLAGALATTLVYLAAAAVGLAALPPAPPANWYDVGYLAWIVLLAVVIGNFTWHFGVRRVGVVVASMFTNLSPVFAILISAAMGVEPRQQQIAGGALVLAGLFQAQARNLFRRRKSVG